MRYKLEKPVHGTIGREKYTCTIEWRNGKFIADEPVTSGGEDRGPDPYTLLLSSLASCTLITLRMYIEKKEWDINELSVNVNMFQTLEDGKRITTIDRDLKFPEGTTDEQKEKLLEIAQACPISAILQGDIHVRTYVYHTADTNTKLQYSNGDVTVVWKPELCKHSARCVTGLPGVFDIHKKPWVTIGGADSNAIRAQVDKCPTGALSYFNNSELPQPE
jgi:putative redox protein